MLTGNAQLNYDIVKKPNPTVNNYMIAIEKAMAKNASPISNVKKTSARRTNRYAGATSS